jgi:Asp-tRNA(Asn)/Glu-tRNA(Gln) amidotransferase A subunit family amidase
MNIPTATDNRLAARPVRLMAKVANRDNELCYQPARVLARWLRRREVSAAEILETHLRRIERHNGGLNAIVSLDAERARAAAATADAALARGEVWGPLHGVPMTLKDALDVAGLPVGIQLVGPRWSDMRLLDIARELEQAENLPGDRPPPSY